MDQYSNLGMRGLQDMAAGAKMAPSPTQERVSTRLNSRISECNSSLRSSVHRIENAINQLSYEGNQPMPPVDDKVEAVPDSTLDAQSQFVRQLEEHVARLSHLASRLEQI